MTVYTQRQHLKYTAEQLFDLVADVERYPEIFPWTKEVYSHRRNDRMILVDMTIAFGPLRQRFSTAAVLDRPHRIDIGSQDPMFERFEQRWTFAPAAKGGTNVEYRVDLEFCSRVLQMLMQASFAERAAETMACFEHRAHRLYGGNPDR
jgi:coenzyme Q-binding protein COQ10